MLATASSDITTVLSLAVIGFMGVRLVSGARVARSRAGRTVASAVRRRIGWRHVWPVPLVLAAVIAVATPLMFVPGLDWGWWSALGGAGNPVFGSADATSGTVWEWLLPIAFIALLVPALPLFAHAEERSFRAGAEGWSRPRRITKVLQFGLVHALIGIPLAAAIALSVGGAYFMWSYLRAWERTRSRTEATLESAAAHTAYNAVIVAAFLVVLLVEAVSA